MSRKPDATWPTASGVTLKICALPSGPDLLAWWWPLHRAARWAWYARLVWPVLLEDFEVVGQLPRAGRPDLWIYRHRRTGLELFLDDDGCAHRMRPVRTTPMSARFTPCDLRTALLQCGLHRLPPVEPCDWDRVVGRHDVVTPYPTRPTVGPAPPSSRRRPGAIAGSIGPVAPSDGVVGRSVDPAPTGPVPPPPERSVRRLRAVPDPPSPPELPLVGPFGEADCTTCDAGTCPACVERAHRANDWCEDPTCARCNGGDAGDGVEAGDREPRALPSRRSSGAERSPGSTGGRRPGDG